MAKPIRNMAASVLTRLNNLSKQTGRSHQQLIIRFVKVSA